MTAIVNGLINPDVMCPGGNPETFHIGPQFGGAYTCLGDMCIVEPLWDLHLGATEMWCAKVIDSVTLESEHVSIAVPEINSGLMILIASAVLYILISFLWKKEDPNGSDS